MLYVVVVVAPFSRTSIRESRFWKYSLGSGGRKSTSVTHARRWQAANVIGRHHRYLDGGARVADQGQLTVTFVRPSPLGRTTPRG